MAGYMRSVFPDGSVENRAAGGGQYSVRYATTAAAAVLLQMIERRRRHFRCQHCGVGDDGDGGDRWLAASTLDLLLFVASSSSSSSGAHFRCVDAHITPGGRASSKNRNGYHACCLVNDLLIGQGGFALGLVTGHKVAGKGQKDRAS
jgi:hypothetical protein